MLKRAIISSIKGYQKYISPYIGRSCRFYPSCSEYAVQAYEKYGIFSGTGKAIWRILRCNPYSRGGYDPVQKEKHDK
ncbi:MAG: membrane protein insertion efficiency factor YidD [Candidatus Omnitrophica bacterium]|nr:membrane protein insertion efficiency factor YidD [Candidatus Omnitrophota bacterium]MDD5488718.1 membrane protein insertion efficiency factor YidD [Candidatus Omnitrophota bacterium]